MLDSMTLGSFATITHHVLLEFFFGTMLLILSSVRHVALTENKCFVKVKKSCRSKSKHLLRISCAGAPKFESPRPAKSYTALQTVRHRFFIYFYLIF